MYIISKENNAKLLALKHIKEIKDNLVINYDENKKK